MAPRPTTLTGRILRTLLGLATAATVTASIAAAGATPAAAEPTLKPVLGGLMDRHKAPLDSFRGTVDSWVAEAGWADLQPVAGGPITSDNAIDQAMRNLGGPIGFQTATPDKIGDPNLTLRWAVAQGAAHCASRSSSRSR